MGHRAFALGESEDVRRTILSPVRAIELLNRRVPRENDGELRIRDVQRSEHRSRAPPELQARHASMGAFLHHEAYRHRRIV
jgi:hypothetical protein